MASRLKMAVLSAAGAMLAACAPVVPVTAQAQWYMQNPGYLQAMSDLRTAYWLIDHKDPNSPGQAFEESQALQNIHAAFGYLKDVNLADGSRPTDGPPPNFVWGDHRGRLHQAYDLLMRAHQEVGFQDPNPLAAHWRNAMGVHLDAAIRYTGAAIQHWGF